MTAKRSSRALALLLALPSAAFALGLGDIHLLSPLNAPLDAEIEVTDVAPDEINTLQAHIASRETFSQQGLEYPNYLTSAQLKLVHTPDGRELIKIKSTDPITDPFVTLLINVTWSHGQLVREYTMLLDPPVYTPNATAANAPVSAPVAGSDTRAGAITRSAETPAPAPAEAAAPAPAPVTPASDTASAAAVASPAAAANTTPAPSPAATESAPAAASTSPEPPPPTAAAAEQGANTTHTVQRGETLSEIARGVAGSATNSPRARSWMLAIYQANPRAFEQNMNLMRAGAVLRIPDASQADAIPAAEASSEIRKQFAAWRATGTAPSGASEGAAEERSATAQPGRLHLVTPSQGGAGGTGPAANGADVAALKGQVKDLEGQLAESKRLLDLKNQDLARLQSELAAKQGTAKVPAPAPAPVPAPMPAPAPTPAPVAKAPAPEVAPAPVAPAPAEEKPPVVAEAPPPAPKPAFKPLAADSAKKPTPASAPAESGSILDTIIGYWWVLALLALVLAVVAGLRYLRSRRAAEFDDSLGRLAVAAVAGASGAGGALGGAGPARGSGGFDGGAMRATPLADHEPDVLVEETGTHERPRIVAAGAAAATSAAGSKHVTADDTISSETAINLDQGDPLAEADFHMAYGLYDQAADLIRIAISREPARRDLKLKLLEVFFVWGNKEQFLQTAHELAQTRGEAAPGEWEKILIMGKQLAPEDPLFSSGGAVSGATAGGVDLNLEGGQSRVDFDLLGEPVPTDMPQGVDLDIGAAVGEGTAQMTEATTGVTDRNLTALHGDRTGSTRQMTTRMRQPSDAEGPTVEQPTLETPDAGMTVRTKPGAQLRSSSAEQTAELAIDDLGLDLGSVDTAEQPALGVGADAPTMVAGLDDRTRKNLEDTAAEAAHVKTSTTGQWQFDQEALETALTQAGPAQDGGQTSRLAALRGDTIDVDLSSSGSTGTHQQVRDSSGVDLDLGTSTQPGNGNHLDLDVGTATVPDAAFAATQRLASEDLALPDLEPVTMSEVGTKLDLARAYMDMGDPDGARNILEEVLSEGSAAQKQEAQRLMESLPG
jgi:pilus assembly protein FimV